MVSKLIVSILPSIIRSHQCNMSGMHPSFWRCKYLRMQGIDFIERKKRTLKTTLILSPPYPFSRLQIGCWLPKHFHWLRKNSFGRFEIEYLWENHRPGSTKLVWKWHETKQLQRSIKLHPKTLGPVHLLSSNCRFWFERRIRTSLR